MAELKDLTIKVKVDVAELKKLADESIKTGKAVEKGLGDPAKRTSEGITSSFRKLEQSLLQSTRNIVGGIGRMASVLTSLPAIIAGIAGAAGFGLFIKTLVDAGNQAEAFITRLGAILQTTQEETVQVFRAIREFAAPLPATTEEIVEAFTTLAAINITPTLTNLENLVKATLALKVPMQEVLTAVQSLEQRTLRRFAITLERDGVRAVLRFKNTIIEVANTDQAIREGLVRLFGEAFPDAMERAQNDFATAVAVMKSLIGDLLTDGASPLMQALTGIVQRINEWIQRNKELLQQRLVEFVTSFAIVLQATFEIVKVLSTAFKDFSKDVDVVGLSFLAAGESLILFLKASKGAVVLQGILKALATPVGTTSQAIDVIKKQIAETSKALDEIERAIAGVERELDKAAMGFIQAGDDIKFMKESTFDLNEFLDKFASNLRNTVKGSEEVKEEINKVNDSLENQIKQLEAQVATFGKSKEEMVEYTAQQLLLEGASQKSVERFKELSLELLRLNSELEAGEELFNQFAAGLKGIEERAKEFEKLKLELLPESEKLRAQLRERLEVFDELVKVVGVKTEEAQALREKIILESESKITDAVQKENIERLRASGSFPDAIKAGFLEFVESAKSNSELMAEFWANTMTQMSQTASEFLFNALTGKFKDLVDVAKGAFRAILRAFLDMVAAIVSREIIVKIGGIFSSAGGGGGGGVGGRVGGVGSSILNAVASLPSLSGLFGGAGAGATVAGLAPGIPPSLLGISGGTATAGLATAGTLSTIATVASIAAIAIPAVIGLVALIGGLFKKEPELDIDIGLIKDEMGKRGALVREFFTLTEEELVKISKRKVKVNVDVLRKQIIETIKGTIAQIQNILAQLPDELFTVLNRLLLQTRIDIENFRSDRRLLEFDLEGKKIQEKLKQFFEGELQARFVFAIRSFFETALASLGVLPERAEAFVAEQFEAFKKLGTKEERAAFGQEFLRQFEVFVKAFNIVEGNMIDAVSATIKQLQVLAQQIGFSTIPSLEHLREAMRVALEEGNIEAIEQLLALRDALMQLTNTIIASINSLTAAIADLNSKIVSLGGSSVDVTAFLKEAIASIQALLETEGLSLEEREALLGQMTQLVDQLVAAQLEAQRRAIEAQVDAINRRIEGLEAEAGRIRKNAELRLEALRMELKLAEFIASIQENIRDILLGPESIENIFQRVARAQAEIASLFAKIPTATPEERLRIGAEIQELLNTLHGLAGEAFQQPSLEFRDQFRDVIEQLEMLQEMVGPTRSIEEINASIEQVNMEMEAQLEAINAQIEALRAQSSALQAQANQLSGQAAAEARAFYEFIRAEFLEILELRLQQLQDVTSASGNIDMQILNIEIDQLAELQAVNGNLSQILSLMSGGSRTSTSSAPLGPIHAQSGFSGIVRKPTLILAGESGAEHVNITPLSTRTQQGTGNITVNVSINGNIDSKERVDELVREVVRHIRFSTETRRQLEGVR